jgi:hypothetical protein
MGGRIGLESASAWAAPSGSSSTSTSSPSGAGAASGELAGARVLLVGFPPREREALERRSPAGARAGRGRPRREGVARLVAEISLAKPYHSALLYARRGPAARAALPPRGARPAPPSVLAVPRDADVQRFELLSSGFASVLELPFDKRRLFNVLHSVAAGDECAKAWCGCRTTRAAAPPRKLRVLVADDNPDQPRGDRQDPRARRPRVTLVNDGEQRSTRSSTTRSTW